MVVLLALCSAGLFGASSVLMHSRARLVPAERSLRAGLLTDLARQPLWLAGLGAQAAGFGLQAAALGVGSLVIVQAIGPTSLLVALPLAARMLSEPMRRSDLLGIAATVGGITAFVAAASPRPGTSQPQSGPWMVVIVASVLLTAALVAAGSRRSGPIRAVAFATASGTVLAINAALTKTVLSRFGQSLGSGLSAWELYALVCALLLGMLLMQSSFQAGRIDWSLPALTVSNPALSIMIGATAFHETFGTHPATVAALVASLAVAAIGVVVLARSPALKDLHEADGRQLDSSPSGSTESSEQMFGRSGANRHNLGQSCGLPSP